MDEVLPDTFESCKQVFIEWLDDMINFWKETRDRLEALYARGQLTMMRVNKHLPYTPPNIDFVTGEAEIVVSMKQLGDFMLEMRNRLAAAQNPLEFLKALDLSWLEGRERGWQ